jgi:hypothetical protein
MTQAAPRYGIVALARSDRRLMEATLQSIARLSGAPDEVALVVSKLRAHVFAAANPSLARQMDVVTSEAVDALPLADAFRAMAGKVDIIVFVPEGVVLDPDYLAAIRETAQRWQDMVGELDVIDQVVDSEPAESERRGDGTVGNFLPTAKRNHQPGLGVLRSWRARTLCASVLWIRVEACGNLKFMAFPQTAEYLAFASLLDQLRPRGRTRVVTTNAAVQVRSGPERRSGFEAGRELYDALSRIGAWNDRSDAAFENRASYLEPRAEKLRLLGEQIIRFLGAPAARAHTGSFIKGMWAARREATAKRDRIRQDIRKLR